MRTQFIIAIALALPCCGAEKMDERLHKAVDEVLYRVETSTPGVYRADNPAQRLDIEFDARETRLKHPQGSAAFRLLGYGYGQHLQAPEKAEPKATGNRVEYRRGELTEWYKNESGGLEQGFTLARRPSHSEQNEPLVIALQVDGALQPTIAPEGDAVLLGLGRNNVLRYEGLRSWDARGRAIASRLEVRDREVRLLIDDRDAKYPLVVDPLLVQTAELIAADGGASDHFGWSLSLLGGVLVVGAPGKNSNQGAAYVFAQTGTGTFTLRQKLTASDGLASDQFGWASAQTAPSGNINILIGAPGKQVNGNANQGAVYVFTGSSNNTTFTQGSPLPQSDGAAGDQFGYSLWAGLDQKPIVGAPGKNSNQGGICV